MDESSRKLGRQKQYKYIFVLTSTLGYTTQYKKMVEKIATENKIKNIKIRHICTFTTY